MRKENRKEWKAACGILLLIMSMLTLAFNIQPVNAGGTIYIRADGSVDPPTANITSVDNVTYTFTGNIYDEIVVERDNIVVDGAHYTVQGTGSGTGIDLTGRSNVTIKNAEIKAFTYGVVLYNSSSNSIFENNIKANNYKGIALRSSNNNSICGNDITNNEEGIWLYDSSNHNSIYGNNVTETNEISIELSEFSNCNSICGNNITNNDIGVRLSSFSSNNSVSGNNVINNRFGIELSESSNNAISGNNITANNLYGIRLWHCPNNSICHNSFINNTNQVYTFNSVNVWDDGYPSGGNYWSDYNGTDLYKGLFQNETGSDGIGDIPYVIDENNRDLYPLFSSYPCIHAVAVEDIRPDKTLLGPGVTAKIHVDIANQGHFVETFNVTLYADKNTTVIGDEIIIGNQTVHSLTSGNSTTVTFTWNTAGVAKGEYTIAAEATPVAGETYTADNTLIDGVVTIFLRLGGLWCAHKGVCPCYY